MIGAILCLLALFVAGPIALFFAGALWSAVYGWLFSATAVDAAGNDAGSTG